MEEDVPLAIRPARREEAELVRRFVREARLDPTQLKWENFLVAEADGEVVGVGQLRRYGEVQELGSLVVKQEWRGKGVGAALVRALVERRAGPLYLECRAPTAPYYRRFGFREISWRAVPWPLKAKFGLSYLLSRLFLLPVLAMEYSP